MVNGFYVLMLGVCVAFIFPAKIKILFLKNQNRQLDLSELLSYD